MWRSDGMMTINIDQRYFRLCVTPSQEKHYSLLVITNVLDHCICENFSPLPTMTTRLPSSDSQSSVQHQHSLTRPWPQITRLRSITTHIVTQFSKNIA
jgi:hypothetical protein